ncbi:Vacuolar protein sorting-associated protein 53 [Tulasnella sp. 424]|nr:Vacuolar protein sorting-associated protein 53 [Tulasnella sp. 424]KAG8977319.1 Vacuolar protein sorting-associated protein 53 [Tulasnella sp. 425]
MQQQELPQDVVAGLQRILLLDPSPGDPLDTLTSFKESLARLDTVRKQLAVQQKEIQDEIDALRLELRRDQDPNRLQTIQELIAELLAQMNRIREKATESEAIVQDITKEIQILDLGKKNLVTTITSLKRLQILVNSVSQLENLADAKDYTQIAHTLSATKELFAFFKSYSTVPRVAALTKRFQAVQGRIRTQLERDFDTFFLQDPSKPISPTLISQGCLVVDVLGEDVRDQYIDRYCSMELKDYRRIFKPSDEAGQLDNLSRRFSWFRKQLSSSDEDYSQIFPPAWKAGEHLVARFAEITREDLSTLLAKTSSTMSVAQLLEALQMTFDFESLMATKYGIPFAELVQLAASPLRPGLSPRSTISSAFEQYMSIFVDAQDKALADMLAPFRGAAKSRQSIDSASGSAGATNEGERQAVLPSSTELFYFYAQTLEQCAKLFNGKPLFDMANLHKKWLAIYAEDVLFAGIKGTPKTERERRSMEGRFSEVKTACTVLNTADYCQTTSSELEDKIKEKISEDYQEKVSLQTERDLFVSVISSCIVVLLRELEAACEPAFASMIKTQWGALDTVSGESPYVSDLVKAVGSVLEVVRPHIEQKKYLRNFYDKAASLLIARFTNALVKSRPLKDVGAQQVMIDLQGVKACLLRFPQGMESAALSASYARSVTKSTTQLETLLKVINSPTVIDLKGVSKAEQNEILDTFLAMTSRMSELEATSFLSSLDMDPPVGPIIAGSALNTPNNSSTSLPLLATPSNSGLMTPPLGSLSPAPSPSEPKREVFSDLRRLVNFTMRRERDRAAADAASGNHPVS